MKFKRGDHVRVIARVCKYFDEVGSVKAIDPDKTFPYQVSGLEPRPVRLGPNDLILAEKEDNR